MSVFFSKPKTRTEEPVVPEPLVINGYVMEGNFRNISGGARWDSAVKDGKRWFIKEFMSPVYPRDDMDCGEEYLKACQKACTDFYAAKSRLYAAVRSSETGTLVGVSAFFRWDAHYYAVSPWVDVITPNMDRVAARSETDKLLLLRVLSNTLSALHRNHVVHGDLRPDNLVFKYSPSGGLTLKLIDFDSSYLEGDVPEPEDLAISPAFVSPEVARMALTEEPEPLDCKSDVFSAALLFHQLWCGEAPHFDETKYDYPFESVLDGEPLQLSPELSEELRALLASMLHRDAAKRPSMEEVFSALKGREPTMSSPPPPSPPSPPAPGVRVTERATGSGLKITTSF